MYVFAYEKTIDTSYLKMVKPATDVVGFSISERAGFLDTYFLLAIDGPVTPVPAQLAFKLSFPRLVACLKMPDFDTSGICPRSNFARISDGVLDGSYCWAIALSSARPAGLGNEYFFAAHHGFDQPVNARKFGYS